MLDAKTQKKVRGQFETILAMLGVPADWEEAQPPHDKLTGITVGFKTAGLNDKEIINAYGIGAKIITFKATDFAKKAPKKFDRLEVLSERYTLDEVMPIHINGAVVFYKGIVRGK